MARAGIARTYVHKNYVLRVHLPDMRKKGLFSYKKQQILYLYSQDLKAPTITKLLQKEKLKCSRLGINKFIKLYETTCFVARQPGSGRPSKVTTEIKELVEAQIRLDDETTALQIHHLLTENGYSISLRTILRYRTIIL